MQNVTDVIGSLKRRLDEPFVTVNSVTGDLGIKQAQDEYARLIRNKTPKSRKETKIKFKKEVPFNELVVPPFSWESIIAWNYDAPSLDW